MTTTLKLNPIIELTDEQFYRLCQFNRDLRLERNEKGELIVNPPTGGETGAINFNLYLELGALNKRTQLGICFDSSTGFKLPNGATRSPDVSWVRLDRWESLSPQQQRRFPPLAPDFVIELMSPSDELVDVQAKMREYIDNGVRLGWLINRSDRCVEIYRQNPEVEMIKMPTQLSGENVLPGFILNLS
jgi:Uma2 family endonuclease